MGGTPAEKDAEIQIYVSCKESRVQRTDAALAASGFLSESSLCLYCTSRISCTANLIVLQSGGKVWMKLQVMLQQR